MSEPDHHETDLTDFNVDDLDRGLWALCGIAGAIEVGAYMGNPPFTAPLAVHIPFALTAGMLVAGMAAANFVLVFRGLGTFHDAMEEIAHD